MGTVIKGYQKVLFSGAVMKIKDVYDFLKRGLFLKMLYMGMLVQPTGWSFTYHDL